jgi:ankyrin repeat protein
LIFAAHNGKVNSCRKLLEEGADPSLRSKRGHLPLHECVANSNLPVSVRIQIAKMLVCGFKKGGCI